MPEEHPPTPQDINGYTNNQVVVYAANCVKGGGVQGDGGWRWSKEDEACSPPNITKRKAGAKKKVPPSEILMGQSELPKNYFPANGWLGGGKTEGPAMSDKLLW